MLFNMAPYAIKKNMKFYLSSNFCLLTGNENILASTSAFSYPVLCGKNRNTKFFAGPSFPVFKLKKIPLLDISHGAQYINVCLLNRKDTVCLYNRCSMIKNLIAFLFQLIQVKLSKKQVV